MEIYRLKEEIDSLDLQNVENLTDNMKTACPALDNTENNFYTESTSDHLKDSDDKENHDISNENSLDRISRRPVESWKYQSLKAENNRTSYKCSLCCSVYQHKKSLNKHWKDKHLSNNPNSYNPVGSQDRAPQTMNMNLQPMFASTNVVIYPNGSESGNFSIKNEPSISQIIFNNNDEMENTYNKVNRKRMSLQLDTNDDNKENCSSVSSKRLSMIQPIAMNNMPLVLKPNNSNNVVKFANNVVVNGNFSKSIISESTENVLDLRKPNNGALDLRTTPKPSGLSRMTFRCFQCTFRSDTILELNDHFKMLHMSILIGVKSYQIPVNLFQKLLMNQFNAIIRTNSEPLETFNNRMSCCLCNLILPTRYDMIQHVGAVHEMEMIWICLVCGFGCIHPIQLSHHFQSHSTIQLLSKPVQICPWTTTPSNPAFPINNHNNNTNNNNSDLQIDKLVPPDLDNHLATSTPISSNKCKRITSKKEPAIIDSLNSREKTLKCLVCDATARWRSELFTHMITHSEHRSFGCKFCSYRSKWKWDVPKHLKRCRLAPPHVRKPDVQNSYLITLLHHYSPPPGDILHQFMKEYNIKDIGSLNKSVGIKNENDEGFQTPEQSSTSVEIERKSDVKTTEIDASYEVAYEAISDATEGELDVDVGTDLISNTKNNTTDSDMAIKCTFKRCPWCQAFLTNKPSEMSSHLAQCHGDMDTGHS